jgi:serine/threonine protein kinase/tetratricopeptide (TPR) repeat protein
MLGKTISHYLIQEQLGAGGMGVVYRARDERLGRDVALKLLPAEAIGDAAARQRLEHEARTASALNHPHVCTIYDVGEAEGQVYLAMEFVAGQPLSHSISTEGLPEASIVRIGVQLADALEHAHQHGITHRDLKSANVMLTPDGRAKILDFGLAVRRQEELGEVTRSRASLADAGGIVGTLSYMAPEVLRGQPADARSDLWALGVILFEMTTGQLPFRGQSGFDLTSSILRDATPAMPQRVSPSLAGIIRRCLEKEPAQRYQRAGEVRAALEAIGLSTTTIPIAQAPHARPAWRTAILSVAALVVVGALLVALNIGGMRERLLGRPATPQIHSIAVLPLENLSGDASQEFFADGMTEALISSLAQIRALKVISRTSVMRFKGSKESLPQIAKELNVDAVVEGSVVRSAGRVRVTAQLIHAATDSHLWAREYDRELSDVLKLQSEVARAIADEIRIQVTPEERERLSVARSINPAAHEAYLLGRSFWNKRTEEGMQKGIQYFNQAIEMDPNYALAYAGLADSYALLSGYTALSPREAFPRAKAAATKALELDSNCAEAHTSLALVYAYYEWNFPEAAKEFLRALELNPSYATGHHWYAHYLMEIGKLDEAAAEMKLAVELDPLSPIITTEVGYPPFFARKYDQAAEALHKAVSVYPDFFRAHWVLGQIYEQRKMYPEAVAEFRKAVEQSGGNAVMRAGLGHVWALSGNRAEAQKILEQSIRLSKERYFSPYYIAEIYIALGQQQQALDWLEKAYLEHDFFMRWLKIDPRLDPLRSQPRFQELVRRMNFSQ